ncbi:LCP family protein [Nocardiopsis composta]|uniref:LCP family protein n=1 Tax=Nocardiopsis composta TaxID=157465 RepID=UPI0016138BB4|nr:LCP family protein [Nocardiopsis composta]
MANQGADERPEADGKESDRNRSGTGRALLLTAASVVLPGIAHLRSGRRAAGTAILAVYALLIAGAATAGVLLAGNMARGARMAVQSEWLLTAAAAAFVLAVLWMTVIVHSWVITRPRPAGAGVRIGGAALVLVLCLCVAAPAGAVMHTSYTAYDTLTSVFGGGGVDGEPHDAADPWNGRDRIEVLLIGGDSGSNRYGMRTDSVMLASIDVHDGDTVLISLPRNLEDVQFPKGSKLAEAYPPPYGFNDIFNEIYQTIAEDPEQLAENPQATDPAADTLKGVVGHITGLEAEYYALVDMKGFEAVIDAIGGIDVHIDEPIPYGQEGAVLEAGDQHLNGNQALWYGRSRVNSDDYTRMGRQGCLVKYVVEQADPATVLTSFQELAGATKKTLRTDIPQAKLPAFIELAETVSEEGEMKSLQLSPPQVNPAYPDWKEIRRLVADAVSAQQDDEKGGDDRAAEPEPSASASSPSPSEEGAEEGAGEDGDSTEWQDYTGLPEPSPTTPGRQVGDDATSLDSICP